MTIAVDGPAGSGKSTVAFAVAQRLEYLFVDTGAFYRAITYLALERGLDLHDPDQLVRLTETVHLDMTPDLDADQRQYTLLADGRDITPHLHSPDVDRHVSIIASTPGVRRTLLGVQRAIAARGRVVMAGRDIGTVVLPDADLKVFIDASLDKRAERRFKQRIEDGEPASLDDIRESMRQRDEHDTQRDISPLRRAPDAIYLDTSDLTLEQAIEALYQIVKQHNSVQNQAAG